MVVHKLTFTGMTWATREEQTQKPDYSIIGQSSVATVGEENIIWINGTQPVMGFPDGPPDSMFPFTRLASATVSDLSLTCLYHQINGTTFAEEKYDTFLHAWTATEYITVSDS